MGIIGDPYAASFDLEQRVGSEDDGTFHERVLAASRAIEQFTRRQFNRYDTNTMGTRRYRALDPSRLPVDDFFTTDGLVVEVNGVEWEDGSVDARPWDGVVDGQPGWPFFDLFAVNRQWPTWSRRPVIEVTAAWGWPDVPEGIRQATLNVAEYHFKWSGSDGSVRSETVGGYSVTYQSTLPGAGAVTQDVPPGMELAVPYRRRRFGVS